MTKYHARSVIVDNVRFASNREAMHYGQLKMLERGGKIFALSLQVPFPLHAKGGEEVAKYIADFTFMEDGKLIVCDSKGFRTDMFRLKKRWLKSEYGITIREM